MAGKTTRPSGKIVRISAPEPPQSPPDQRLSAGRLLDDDEYSDLILAHEILDEQIATHISITRAIFKDVGMAGTRLQGSRWRDARLEHCNLGNAHWADSSLTRIEVVDCRMTGMVLSDSTLSEASFNECRADLALFRASRFKNARFSRCNLHEADFSEADLTGVAFFYCDLTAAQFAGARLAGADFRGSRLESIQARAGDLRGAIIDPSQLVALAPDLARLMGLKVLESL